MNPLLVAPLLLTLLGVVAGWFLPRVASPSLCVRVLTAATVVAAAGVASGLALIALAGASELHAVTALLGWCEALYPGDHGAAPLVGLAAIVALSFALRGAGRYHRQVRSERHEFRDVDGVEIIAVAGPVAFAVPGSPGGVVLGRELIRCLEPDERRAVLAHERAHLELHHHRFVHTAEICSAAFPFLNPLARQVRFNTERWADEAAATQLGSRALVARAIARVALLGWPRTSTRLAFDSLGASARVKALLEPRVLRRYDVPIAASALTILTTLAGSSVQVHHLASFVSHACPV